MTATSAIIFRFTGPRVEPARDCDGFYVIRGAHGWLHSDREAAIADLDEIAALERLPWRQHD
jgi:hypothetical protein